MLIQIYLFQFALAGIATKKIPINLISFIAIFLQFSIDKELSQTQQLHQLSDTSYSII